jgi:ATP-binding cassette subfamily F protein uup
MRSTPPSLAEPAANRHEAVRRAARPKVTMPAPLIQLTDIALTFGGAPLFTGVGMKVEPGERIALVGRNGSGKSTLMRIAAGLVEPDRGGRFVTPGARVRYLPQEEDFSRYATAREAVLDALGPDEDPFRALALMDVLGLTGEEDPKRLSGGEAKRVALAAALAPEPDLLLLDEPTNHLDLPTIAWLEEELSGLRSAIVLISHDRAFLSRLSRATIWIDRAEARRIPEGFAAFEAWRDRFFEEEEAAQQKLARAIEREEHWLRYGVTARRKRNVRRLANLATLRAQRRDFRGPDGGVRMAATEAEASGKIVIEAVGVSKGFGERRIASNLSLRIARGDRIGVIGANGAGKTTLVNLLTGVLAPDSGVVSIGPSVAMVTLDQKREALDPAAGVADTLTEGRSDFIEVAGKRRHVASYMADFLFRPEQARTPVSRLSGGERGRLMLARALAKPSNLLVLDEPTNDLDLETLDLLEELLADYPGTIVLVSHDRDFLDRVCTSVLLAEGDGRWTEYAGGYSDMLAQRGAGLERRAPRAPAARKPDVAAPPPVKGKAGAKERHRLGELETRMPALERDIAKVLEALGEADLYARDPARFVKLNDLLGKLQRELSANEEEWLALSERIGA